VAEKKAQKPIKETDFTNEGVKINNDVICVVGALAAVEVEGVANVGSGPKNKKNISKGVKVKIQDGSAICDVSLSVNFGENIKEVATKVQQNVKRSIESMLGLTVSVVNVHVIGVDFGNAPAGVKTAVAVK
jgi:uncharacterized alkaline shock family protein YloU